MSRQLWHPGDLAPLDRLARLAQMGRDDALAFARLSGLRIIHRGREPWTEARTFLDLRRAERIAWRRDFEQAARQGRRDVSQGGKLC